MEPTTPPPVIRHPPAASGACSMLFDADGTSAYGTAARASCFVVLEQDGPWGRDAATESHLDPEVGARLNERVSSAGGRFMVMRHPGRHADSGAIASHRLLLASSPRDPALAWTLAATLTDPAALDSLDVVALAAGDRPTVRRSLEAIPGVTEIKDADPALLVCTNGRRDVCCAVRGRPVAASVARANPTDPDAVWEVSHTGGHRFAPTAVLLPWGIYLARLSDETGAATVRDARVGRLPSDLLGPAHDRGQSGLPPEQQSALSAVRALLGETEIAALRVEPDGIVRHRDGRAWQVNVTKTDLGLARPESCGKAPVDVHAWQAETIMPVGSPRD